MDKIFSACKIPMPTDAKRNMMNASSNFEIIRALLGAVRDRKEYRLHCPGVFGEIGGYPVRIDGRENLVRARIDESCFALDEMRRKNQESIYLDGIEDVRDGTLVYTDELIGKAAKAFGTKLPKEVPFAGIEETADFIIRNIIEKNI